MARLLNALKRMVNPQSPGRWATEQRSQLLGFRNWLSRLFVKPASAEMVRCYDFDVGSVVQIPRRELRPGAIQVQIEGMDGLVWVLADQLQAGPIQHEPFDQELRNSICHIQTTFAEHRDLTVDEWEDGLLDVDRHRLLASWAANCAEHVLPLFVARHPSDDRPRRAIEMARAWSCGEATVGEAREAAVAAHAAARSTSDAAACAVARAAGHNCDRTHGGP